MPTGESSAVQKWNSCGVFGLRSVATTRPSGVTLNQNRSSVSSNRSHHRAEEFLAVANSIHHLVPSRIGQRERRDLGENPTARPRRRDRESEPASPIVRLARSRRAPGPTSDRVRAGRAGADTSSRRSFALATSRETRSFARRREDAARPAVPSPSAYSVRWLFTTPTTHLRVATRSFALIPPSMNSGSPIDAAPLLGQRMLDALAVLLHAVNRRVANRERMLAGLRVDVGAGGRVDDLNSERAQRVVLVARQQRSRRVHAGATSCCQVVSRRSFRSRMTAATVP